jgi:hypothetical protein
MPNEFRTEFVSLLLKFCKERAYGYRQAHAASLCTALYSFRIRDFNNMGAVTFSVRNPVYMCTLLLCNILTFCL